MSDEWVLSRIEIARMRAWRVCLYDALQYIALARDIGAFVEPDRIFHYKGGTGTVGGTVQKGLFSAAVISASQLSAAGYAGEAIANNSSSNLTKLRDNLFKESDKRNGWSAGQSKGFFNNQMIVSRNKFLAHYDGDVSEYHETFDESDGSFTTTWRTPNSLPGGEFFSELEKMLSAMQRALTAVLNRQPIPSSDRGA